MTGGDSYLIIEPPEWFTVFAKVGSSMPNLDKVPLNARNVGNFPVYDVEITITDISSMIKFFHSVTHSQQIKPEQFNLIRPDQVVTIGNFPLRFCHNEEICAGKRPSGKSTGKK